MEALLPATALPTLPVEVDRLVAVLQLIVVPAITLDVHCEIGAAHLTSRLIAFAGFGRALRNPLRVVRGKATLVAVKSLV